MGTSQLLPMQRRQGARARESRHAALSRIEVVGNEAMHGACLVRPYALALLSEMGEKRRSDVALS